MALYVENVDGSQCLRWEICNWSKFLSCWLILEVSCGAEDAEHLGEGIATVQKGKWRDSKPPSSSSLPCPSVAMFIWIPL